MLFVFSVFLVVVPKTTTKNTENTKVGFPLV
jgi:hypothetical protein